MMRFTQDKEFIDTLKEEENGVEEGLAGGKWYPYILKGENHPTVAYGHAILGGQKVIKINGVDVDITRGITEKQAHDLLIQDLIIHRKKAMKEWIKHDPIPSVKWDDLDPTYKNILTEITFNVGTLEAKDAYTKRDGTKVKVGDFNWPKLAKAIKNNNVEQVLAQTSRTFGGKRLGRVKPFQELWRPRLHKMQAKRASFKKDKDTATPTKEQVASLKAEAQIRNLKSILPDWDRFGKQTRVKLLAYAMQKEQERETEKGRVLSLDDKYIESMEQEADGRDRELQETLERDKRTEAEDSLIREQQEEQDQRRRESEEKRDAGIAKAITRVDETDKVITEQLSDISYFQREDGSVVAMKSSEILDA